MSPLQLCLPSDKGFAAFINPPIILNPSSPSPERRRFLGRLFFGMFALALVMGPGPGIYLINPNPGDPEARRFLFSMPIIYVWASFWFIVQASVVALSYIFLWNTTEDPSAHSGSK